MDYQYTESNVTQFFKKIYHKKIGSLDAEDIYVELCTKLIFRRIAIFCKVENLQF